MSAEFIVGAYSNSYFIDWDSFPPEMIEEMDGFRRFKGEAPDNLLSQPDREKVLAWQAKLAADHPDFLPPAALWDESSTVADGDVVSREALADARHVALALDVMGDERAAAHLRGVAAIDDHMQAMQDLTEDADRPLVRFRHFLFAANWLPTATDTVILAPGWHGEEEDFGSLPCLIRELDDLAVFIRQADPSAAADIVVDADHEPPTVLARAWVAVAQFGHFAAMAREQHLPLVLSE